MDWDQIESKWVAMTRRVRSDLPVGRVDLVTMSRRRVTPVDAKGPAVLDKRASVVNSATSQTTVGQIPPGAMSTE